MGSPKSLFEVADRISKSGEPPLIAISYHMSDFRHESMDRDAAFIALAVKDEPVLLGDPAVDIFLAGLAECLSERYGLAVPAWTLEPCRFARELIYPGSAMQREHYIDMTPRAWRRRNLICGECFL
jgi:hypothetical protein